MKTLRVTLPDGTEATRTTDHPYRFVVVAKLNASDVPDVYEVNLWTTRRDLAEKRVALLQNELWGISGRTLRNLKGSAGERKLAEIRARYEEDREPWTDSSGRVHDAAGNTWRTTRPFMTPVHRDIQIIEIPAE